MVSVPDDAIIVRTVTVFIPSHAHNNLSTFQSYVTRAIDYARRLRKQLTNQSGILVQTVRISCCGPQAFGTVNDALQAADILNTSGADYCNLGMIRVDNDNQFIDHAFITKVIKRTAHVSLSISVTHRDEHDGKTLRINRRAVAHGAMAISEISKLEPTGFANLRFAVAMNVQPYGPFFPVSYSGDQCNDEEMKVALGIQGATLIQHVISQHQQVDNDEIYVKITQAIEQCAERLQQICKPVLENQSDVLIDFSTAPFPEFKHSIGAALASCSKTRKFPGVAGLTAVASMAAAIDRASFKKTGYCGMMLPVSEDPILAKHTTSLNEMLLCSSVCGTGLDTVPVAGDLSVRSMHAVITDVACMSARLGGKQLSVRLMPIPGKNAGDMTVFESPYMANGPVLSIEDKDYFLDDNEEEGEEEMKIPTIRSL